MRPSRPGTKLALGLSTGSCMHEEIICGLFNLVTRRVVSHHGLQRTTGLRMDSRCGVEGSAKDLSSVLRLFPLLMEEGHVHLQGGVGVKGRRAAANLRRLCCQLGIVRIVIPCLPRPGTDPYPCLGAPWSVLSPVL